MQRHIPVVVRTDVEKGEEFVTFLPVFQPCASLSVPRVEEGGLQFFYGGMKWLDIPGNWWDTGKN